MPGIVGLGKAIELATLNIEEHNKKVSFLRDSLLNEIKQNIKDIVINADIKEKLPGNISLSIKGIDAKNLLLLLDMNGICLSSGSACNSSVTMPSHVLKAMGIEEKDALSTIRISLGDGNTIQDIKYISYVLQNAVSKLRNE